MAETLGVELCFEHVRGHQDNVASYKGLQRVAQLNIKKDAEVAEFLSAPAPGQEPTPCALHYPANNISLTIAGVRVTKRLWKAAVQAYNGVQLREYMMEQNSWMATHFDRIDWTALERALGVETHDFPSLDCKNDAWLAEHWNPEEKDPWTAERQ